MSYYYPMQFNSSFMSADTTFFGGVTWMQPRTFYNAGYASATPMFNYTPSRVVIPYKDTSATTFPISNFFSNLNWNSFTSYFSPVKNFAINIFSSKKVQKSNTQTSKFKIGDLWHGHKITSLFGKRKAPKAGASTNHKGVDLKYNTNEAIKSFSSGTVVNVVTNSKGYGKYVDVKGSDGTIHRYAHCNQITVKKGDKIQQGQMIAKAGSTGVSTGTHLHYEKIKDGVRMNPLIA